jgi:predicted permease
VSWLHGISARLRLLFDRRSTESRIDREFHFHIQMEADRLARELSLEPGEARRRALAAFGGVEKHREALRDGRDVSWLHGWSLDLKLGARMLVKYPGLTLVGVLGMSVAVAIGALAFTAVNAVTSTALPMDEGDRVVAIHNIDAQANDEARQTHLHDLEVWREALPAVPDLGAYRILPANLVVGDAAPVSVRAAEMTPSGFRIARVTPIIGRSLRDDDAIDGAPAAAVVGYDLWRDRFGGRLDVVGTDVQLGVTRYTVVGVMPSGFGFPVNNQVWIPLRLNALAYPRGKAPPVDVFGRLAPGASLAEARLQLTTIGQRLATTYPETHEHIRPRVLSYTRAFLDAPGLAWLFHLGQIVVSLLLVVIGTNVAVLVYARTASRAGELAVRTALGASRRRIVTQLFAEAIALSGLASVVGIVAAQVVFRRVEAMIRLSADDQMPYWMHLSVTPAVIVYVAGLAVLAAVIIGVIPGLKATRHQVAANLQSFSGRSSLQLGRGWTALLIAQVAVSVAALPIALAAGERWVRLMLVDYGTPETTSFVVAMPALLVNGEPPASSADRSARDLRYSSRVAELVRSLEGQPGGFEVVRMSTPPSGEDQLPIEVEASVVSSADGAVPGAGRYVTITHVDERFFSAFRVRTLAGRSFTAADYAPGATTAIVNRSFVQSFLGGDNALGRRLRHVPSGAGPAMQPWWEIAGVVDDFPALVDSDALEPKVYLPLRPAETYPMTLAVRARDLAPSAVADRIRELALSIDPDLRFVRIPTVADLVRQEAEAARMALLGLVMVALSVVLLSAAGIYALTSFTVAQRRREIGIRSALGARRGRVLADVLSRAMRQICLGIVIGVAGAGALVRLAGESSDFGGLVVRLLQVAALMAGVGIAASIGPARRALQVQPTEALRSD